MCYKGVVHNENETIDIYNILMIKWFLLIFGSNLVQSLGYFIIIVVGSRN